MVSLLLHISIIIHQIRWSVLEKVWMKIRGLKSIDGRMQVLIHMA